MLNVQRVARRCGMISPLWVGEVYVQCLFWETGALEPEIVELRSSGVHTLCLENMVGDVECFQSVNHDDRALGLWWDILRYDCATTLLVR